MEITKLDGEYREERRGKYPAYYKRIDTTNRSGIAGLLSVVMELLRSRKKRKPKTGV